MKRNDTLHPSLHSHDPSSSLWSILPTTPPLPPTQVGPGPPDRLSFCLLERAPPRNQAWEQEAWEISALASRMVSTDQRVKLHRGSLWGSGDADGGLRFPGLDPTTVPGLRGVSFSPRPPTASRTAQRSLGGRNRVWAGGGREPLSPAPKLLPDGAARTRTLDLSSPRPGS